LAAAQRLPDLPLFPERRITVWGSFDFVVIPGLPAPFAGGTRNPCCIEAEAKSWIPGSTADEAGDGPGMTRGDAGEVARSAG
jgi:hypothetical protein